jgi:rhodanese-related sulfurtransferase
MNPRRLTVTFPATTPPASLDPAIEVFHRFIQRGLVEGLVIDVADYRHVPQGPGVLLIGLDVDYGVSADGLTVTRKRSSEDPAGDQFRDAVRMGLGFLQSLDYDGGLDGEFDRSRVTVAVPDRSLDGDVAGDLIAEIEPVTNEIWVAAKVTAVESDDPRRAASVGVEADAAAGDGALERLGGSRAPGQSGGWDIRVEEFVELRESGADFVLLDVREESELEITTLGGVNIPLADLPDRLDELDKDAHVIVHCRAGRRGGMATAQLREAGFTNAWNLNGALMAMKDRVDPSIPKY